MRDRKYIVFGLLIALLGQVLTHTYRPFVYENQLCDFHIADTIGSFLCVPAATLFYYGLSDKYTIKTMIFKSALVFILYELFGLFNIHGTFDVYDIVAIVLSSICSFFLFKNMPIGKK